MTAYLVSPQAEQDVFEIWQYLANQASVDFANRVESELFDAFALLARNPGLGHKREDLTAFPVLFFRAFPYQYMVIYRAETPLQIVGVLHARRDMKKLLQHRRP
ncbi:MAG: type II toxin-antitoxin system RelE/ParE family toxin [Bryobacterales bacterium]